MRPGFVPALVVALGVGSCTLDFGRFDPPVGASGPGVDGSTIDDSADAPAIVPIDADATMPEASPASDAAPTEAGGSDAARDAADAGPINDGAASDAASDGGTPVDGAPDASSLASGLVAFYMFDETSGTSAADSSGNGYTATLTGGASFAAGLVNHALTLNGTSQYVSLPSGVVTSLTSSFSVATWVKLNASPTWSRIFDFGSGTNAYSFLTPNSGTNFRFGITTGGAAAQQTVNAAAIATGSWQHVVVTLAPNSVILYVNGAVAGQSTTVTLNPSSLGATTQRWIGRSEFTADPYTNGLFDNFRVYSRALTGAEVQALYASHL